MSEPQLEEILRGLNVCLEVYHDRIDTLSAVDISLKTHVMVLHSQVAEQLQEIRRHSNFSSSAN